MIKIYSLETKEYNIYKYIIILIYILSKNNIILIRREIYIINDLSIKVLIDINIIKSKFIILDINSNLTIIESYNNLQILILIIVKSSRTNTIIISKTYFIVLTHSFLIISIKSINLSINKNLIFKLE